MKKFLSAFLSVFLLFSFHYSSFAVDNEVETIAPWHIFDSVACTFYIDESGVANISYIVTCEKSAFSVKVYVEKKVSAFEWKQVGNSKTVIADKQYQTGAYTVKVDGDGEYRAVITASPDKDTLKQIVYCTYHSSVYYGDMDGDGRITAADARIVLRIGAHLVAGSTQQIKKADMNGDGKINSIDARRVLRIAAKLE